MTTEQKVKNSDKNNMTSPVIIETTYEKVLSIINKVKDFIKKSSSNTNKLIEELEWVIKVITNKSLYSYELTQEKLSKQNAEYEKFISFVTKYNEEVLMMNKKHDIVSSIFSLGKKGEILLKPSLCLKKILPNELQNMDERVEKEKRSRQKNFINVFGNYVLDLYYKYIEKRRESIEFIEDTESIEKNKGSINININEQVNNKKKNKFKSRQKSDDILKEENNYLKKYKTYENSFFQNDLKTDLTIKSKDKKNNNIHRIKIFSERDKQASNYSKLKLKKINNKNLFYNFSQKKLYSSVIKLTKHEKETFNSIKKAMKNYFFKFTNSGSQNSNFFPYEKNNFNININSNNNRNLYKTSYNNNNIYNIYINNETYKKSKSNNNNKGKGYMLYKTYKYGSLPHNNSNRNKSEINKNKKAKENNCIFKNQKSAKNINVDSNNYKITFFNFENYYLNRNNKNKSKNKIKLFMRRNTNNNINIFKTKINSKNSTLINNNQFLIEEKNNIEENKNHTKEEIKEENSKKEFGNHVYVKSLVDKFITDIKMITDKDFNIFDFQKKVSYKNVLPIMGYIILKTLGLFDSKIISIRKLNSFLYTISNNYKQTTLYHNSLHGADVTQSLCIFFLNTNAEEICETSVLDLLGMIVSAMGHDLGHPGLNNNFHINASTELGITYNDASCLENYHSSFLFRILRKEENNILSKLSIQNYKTIRKRMISQILATDMANHGEVISLIRSKIKSWKENGQSRFNLLSGNDKTKFDEQQILLNYLIHMADLGHNCKKFEISIEWIKLLTEEFWRQGDQERAKGLPISFLCDRQKIDVPASQIGFLRGFILSSFDCLVAIFPELKYTIDNAEDNIRRWTKLQDEKRKFGWTPKKGKTKEEEEEEDNMDKEKNNENNEK